MEQSTRMCSMPKLCTIDGCGKTFRARGLCATHYNQQHQPNRHRKVEMQCGCCGKIVIKDSGRDKRYKSVYCSQLCRDYATCGHGTTCVIPSDHWSRWIGKTSVWVPPKHFECGWCGETCTVSGTRDTYCTDRCRLKAKRVRRRCREYGAAGTYTWAQVTSLWLAFNMACAYCRDHIDLTDVQAEHVAALAKGGANNIGNILPSCASCNSDKRDLTLTEWRNDRARRQLPEVATELPRYDSRYAHLSPSTHALAA